MRIPQLHRRVFRALVGLILSLPLAGCSTQTTIDGTVPQAAPLITEVSWQPEEALTESFGNRGYVSVLLETESRMILGMSLSASDGWCTISESEDFGDTWIEVFRGVAGADFDCGLSDGVAVGEHVVVAGRSGNHAAVWQSTGAEDSWQQTSLDPLHFELAGVAGVAGAEDLLVAAGIGVSQDRVSAVAWISRDRGGSWVPALVGGSDDPVVDEVVSGVAVAGGTIVVIGRLVSAGSFMREVPQEPFVDGTWDRPVVWVSTDAGGSWTQQELPTFDRTTIVPAEVAATTIGFRVFGSTQWPDSDGIFHHDVAQWIGDTQAGSWTGFELDSFEFEHLQTAVVASDQVYVFGVVRDPALDTDGYQVAVWRSDVDGLTLLPTPGITVDSVAWVEAVVFDSNRWLVAGRTDTSLSSDASDSFSWFRVGYLSDSTPTTG